MFYIPVCLWLSKTRAHGGRARACQAPADTDGAAGHPPLCALR